MGQPLMYWLIGAMFAAPLTYLVPVWLRQPDQARQAQLEALRLRVRSWWFLAGTVLVAAFLSPTLVILLCGLLCYAALKEYVSMIPLRMAYRPAVLLAFVAIPIQLSLASYARLPLFATFIPFIMFGVLYLCMALIRGKRNVLGAAATLHWGLMSTVFSISHVALLLVLPLSVDHGAGGTGLILFLLLMMLANDGFRHFYCLFSPRYPSPCDTEVPIDAPQFVGALIFTILIALVLAPWLTPFSQGLAIIAAALISVAGIAGEMMLATMRRRYAKSYTRGYVPVTNGLMARTFSLSFAAPLFVYFVFAFVA